MTEPESFSNGAGPAPGRGASPGAAGAPRAAGGGGANVLGKYRLVVELARGGMGIVYVGVAQGPAGFSKLLVIKELRPDLADDQDFLRLFLDEARLAARLNHANIAQTYEVDGDRGRYFMAMEYLEGQPLRRLLEAARPGAGGARPPRAMLLHVLSEVLSGLHHAHELCDFDGRPLGVVHRDVSPHNVFLTYDGRAKLLDFGTAKAKDSLHVTVAGKLKGKVTYMAPEQALGLPADRRADVFAAGVMLWEMLVGRKFWEKVPVNEVLLRLTRHDLPPAPSVLVADLPSELDRICAKAMAPNRDDRYATAYEFREDLERYLGASGEEVHPREIGQFLATAFARERATQRAFVEAHARRLAGAEAAAEPAPSAGARPPAPGPAPSPPASLAGPKSSGLGTLPSVVAPSSRGAGSAPRRGAVFLSSLALLGACASVGFGLLIASRAERGLATNRAALAPAAEAPAAPPAPAYVALALRVTPPQARVFLDDVELPPESWNGLHARDGRARRLRVEAEGYAPHAETLVFGDEGLSVAVALEKSAAEPPPPPPPRHRRAPDAGAPAEHAPRGAKARRGAEARGAAGD